MNTTSAITSIAIIGIATAVALYAAVSTLEETQEAEPEIEFNKMYQLDNQLTAEIVNYGDPVNTSQIELKYSYGNREKTFNELENSKKNGERNCIPENTEWSTNQEFKCRTGVKFPDAGETLKLTLRYTEENNEDSWNTTCSPSTSSAVGC